ncbi:hypothetical protein GCM10022291_02810 [Postechiella marina]|uniref:Uncharacterized protein n=1 Tax=Postechiella marina TaxID=943941 RepID=A0ABP8BZK9_9FLAO
MAVSNGIKVEFTSTSELEPGYAIKILTVVGAICGNCEIGSCLIERLPTNTIITEMTIAKTGLFINLLNMIFCRLNKHYSA